MDLFPLEDLVPTESDIKWAVWRMRNNQSGGHSRMRAEHLKEWLEKVRKAEAEVTAEAEAV